MPHKQTDQSVFQIAGAQMLEKSFLHDGNALWFGVMSFPVIAFLAPSGGELILIMLALLLLFGPKDAPRILRSIQNGLNKLQRAAADFRYRLMYGDLHLTSTDESKDTSVYDAEERPAEQKAPEERQESAPEHPPVEEPKHEKPV